MLSNGIHIGRRGGVRLTGGGGTEIITAGKDTSIFSGAFTGYNHGAAANFAVGQSGGVSSRTLLQFDLSALPPTATILDATLRLYCITDAASSPDTYQVFRLKRTWVEGTAIFASSNSGATWNTHDGTNGWQTAGASGANDRESTAIGERAFTATETLNVFKDFLLDTAAVQEWLDGTFVNNGVIVVSANEAVVCNYAFASRENATAANRPKLKIRYTP